MLIFTLLLIILNFSHHISETGSVKYLLQEANSCQEKDDFFTCVCNSDGWNKIQLQIHADCCAIKTGKNILWEKKSFITKVQISIGRKIMRRCNQSREKAATSVGPMISKTADERWNLCPFDCKSLICRQSVKSLLTPTEGPLLANIIIYQIVDFWENWREIWNFNCRFFGG